MIEALPDEANVWFQVQGLKVLEYDNDNAYAYEYG
jgi:hypothetical protein